MIFNMVGGGSGGGGGGEAFAAISVTYPAGSICTCSNGTTTLTAEDPSSGAWLFTVPEGGAWTVTATDGEKTATKTVEVEQFGAYDVTVAYEIVLFRAGEGILTPLEKIYTWHYIDGTTDAAQNATGTSYTITENMASMKIVFSSGKSAYHTVALVDLTDFNTLHLRAKIGAYPQYCNSQIQIRTSADANKSVSRYTFSANTNPEITLDVSSLSGLHDVSLGAHIGSGGTLTVEIYDWWID